MTKLPCVECKGVVDGPLLRYSYGNGKTLEEGIKEYIKIVVGEKMKYEGSIDKYFTVPKVLEFP